jgi:hypothetical protein
MGSPVILTQTTRGYMGNHRKTSFLDSGVFNTRKKANFYDFQILFYSGILSLLFESVLTGVTRQRIVNSNLILNWGKK